MEKSEVRVMKTRNIHTSGDDPSTSHHAIVASGKSLEYINKYLQKADDMKMRRLVPR